MGHIGSEDKSSVSRLPPARPGNGKMGKFGDTRRCRDAGPRQTGENWFTPSPELTTQDGENWFAARNQANFQANSGRISRKHLVIHRRNWHVPGWPPTCPMLPTTQGSKNRATSRQTRHPQQITPCFLAARASNTKSHTMPLTDAH